MDSAILMTIFNRPDFAEQTFAAIRKARPPRLYIAADGPRSGRPQEADKCAASRKILELVDWDCEVHTLLRDENLGCKEAIYSAITWFFENEEQGIILEDDCLPDPSFFAFCDELLNRYAANQTIGMISGNNPFHVQTQRDHSYHFSRIGWIWGWATWRRAWSLYQPSLETYAPAVVKRTRQTMGPTQRFREMHLSMLDRAESGELNTWDLHWFFTLDANNLFTIRPKVNLVANIGHGEEATHTSGEGDKRFRLKESILLPLNHPMEITHDVKADVAYARQLYPNSLPRRLARKLGLRKMLRKIVKR